MDPKLNNGETRSFWMQHRESDAAAYVRDVYRLYTAARKNRAPPLISPETNRGTIAFIISAAISYRSILTTGRSVSSYARYTFPGMMLKIFNN